MSNIENLKPFDTLTVEEQRELASKGGKASVEARREKKLLKELLEEALLKETETGNRYVDITVALIEQAEKGNVKAFEVIRDTMGQKSIEQVSNTITVNNPVVELINSIERVKNEDK
jgi:hypothetical protein